jgi:folylpolyglutamate synthase/dihydrofolate synthase
MSLLLSKSQYQALFMFLTSTLSFVWMARFHRPRLIPTRQVAAVATGGTVGAARSYHAVISELFSVVPRGQRNVENDVMKSRFDHFSSRFKQSGLHNRAKVIHVAGTKGKGSTVEYLNAGLTGCGYKVGVFTSPHIHTARERIKIGRTLIDKDDFVRLAEVTLKELKPKSWAVFFDLLLDMALQYFGEKQVDYIILETGIGGLYDSTNFIGQPAATIITSISYDHQAILGNTLEEIASQKAGIIKKSCQLFTPASQTDGVMDVFRSTCQRLHANLNIVPRSKYVYKLFGLVCYVCALFLVNACVQ